MKASFHATKKCQKKTGIGIHAASLGVRMGKPRKNPKIGGITTTVIVVVLAFLFLVVIAFGYHILHSMRRDAQMTALAGSQRMRISRYLSLSLMGQKPDPGPGKGIRT